MLTRIGIFLAAASAIFSADDARCQALYSFDNVEDYFAAASQWTAWQETLDRHASQRPQIQHCLQDAASCERRLKGLRHLLVKGAELEADQQIRLVNRYINSQHYRDDRVSFDAAAGNQWQTLTEFLRHGGDCEDFAVAKYFILREFGFAADDMRIVIGKEASNSSHHAMLAVRSGTGVLLLENDNTIRRNGAQEISRFVYALNENAIWDHEGS